LLLSTLQAADIEQLLHCVPAEGTAQQCQHSAAVAQQQMWAVSH